MGHWGLQSYSNDSVMDYLCRCVDESNPTIKEIELCLLEAHFDLVESDYDLWDSHNFLGLIVYAINHKIEVAY